MSGHSKWNNIKRKKEKTDGQRAKVFTKIARELAVAVKEGGGPDPAANSKLKDAIAKGGKENMLTGAERSKTLWELNDRLAAFSKKLNRLYLSIRFYTMTDVWNGVTAGMIDRSNGEIATQALSRWRRAGRMTISD